MFDITALIETAPESDTPIRIVAVEDAAYADWIKKTSVRTKNWIEANDYKGGVGTFIPVPSASGAIDRIIAVYKKGRERDLFAAMAERLPSSKTYQLQSPQNQVVQTEAVLGWALGGYRFDKYLSKKSGSPKLVIPSKADKNKALSYAGAVYTVRELINTPTNDLGTAELADFSHQIAASCGAKSSEITGDDLLKQNYPLIHAVGRASVNIPRLVDIRWGKKSHPKITIVGKGVVFDSGGLDIKMSSGMVLMKKDMGGAAHALALLQMIADAKLPVSLRVLLPIVENSISANAYRPGDVLVSRSGKTVEIGNTDAEGRLILADAISEAVTENPEYLIDFATLTGAARVAVGHELGALFSNNEKMLSDLMKSSTASGDRLWSLPLHKPYFASMSSKIADVDNSGSSGYAGATTAALFIESFLGENPPKWAHIDTPGWNKTPQPGFPGGGDAFGVWAVFEFLRKNFS